MRPWRFSSASSALRDAGHHIHLEQRSSLRPDFLNGLVQRCEVLEDSMRSADHLRSLFVPDRRDAFVFACGQLCEAIGGEATLLRPAISSTHPSREASARRIDARTNH